MLNVPLLAHVDVKTHHPCHKLKLFAPLSTNGGISNQFFPLLTLLAAKKDPQQMKAIFL